MSRLIELAKHIPLDLGQGNLHVTTQGKVIARDHIPRGGPGKKALDIGCRHGVQTRWLEDHGYEVTSGDVEILYDKAMVLDANDPLPFDSESFDVVWCSEVIEHLRDPAAAITEMRRVLKPGGMLVITTPNSSAWFFKAASLFGLTPAKLQDPGHLHFFDESDMRALFPQAEVMGYFPYLGYKPTIRRRLYWLTPTFVIVERKANGG
jgi:SAM-dependent methyltransferase